MTNATRKDAGQAVLVATAVCLHTSGFTVTGDYVFEQTVLASNITCPAPWPVALVMVQGRYPGSTHPGFFLQ